MLECTAYVDEAGDEGLGKLRTQGNSGQSHWLAIGACLVRHEHDLSLPRWRNEILAKIGKANRQYLHFRDLSHDQKVVACQHLASKRFGASVVISNKGTLLDHDKLPIFKKRGYLYNYMIRYLLERITQVCVKAAEKEKHGNAKLKVIFSRRGGTDYQSMKEYLLLIKEGRELIKHGRSAYWDVLDIESIKVENHSKWAGLQIADVVTSAVFCAVEPNYYGNCEPRYALELADRFGTNNNHIIDNGITPIPPLSKNPLNQQQREFFQEVQRRRQAPGP